MKKQTRMLAVVAALIMAGGPGFMWAQATTCVVPNTSCSSTDNVTTSQVQIGGPGSVDSDNNRPGVCGGAMVTARFDLSLNRSAKTLTLTISNTTGGGNLGALTGFAFNTPAAVTNMTLDPNNVTGSSLTWSAAFDAVRGDHSGDIRADGFGLFNVFGGNNGVDTGFGGGNPNEILPGNAVTFVFDLTGDLSAVTACSFTSIASIIPPGSKTSIAVGRWQACNQGNSTWMGPCMPQDLLVDLLRDLEVVDVGDGRVRVSWETASEIDNAGFAVLEQGARSGDYRRLNTTLIPAQGSATSGASYVYEHTTAVNGKKIKLRLEDWDFDGQNTMHRPITVVPNPKNPPIKLASPGYEETVSAHGRLQMEWLPVGQTSRRVLQFSTDPTFPEGGVYEIHVGSSTRRSMSRRDMSTLGDMASFGDGGVYWRVKGSDRQGGDVVSDVYIMNIEP